MPTSDGQTLQILGLAFAGADLVIEAERSGVITLALGAVAHLTGLDPAKITKTRLNNLVTPADGGFLVTLLNDLKPGERRGPFAITLAGDRNRPQRPATISAFRLPQNGERVSCAISLAGPSDQAVRNKHGLLAKADFETVAADTLSRAKSVGVDARLEMVEVPGLADAVEVMKSDAADKTMSALGASLRTQSYGGVGGAEVARDRFAVISAGAVSTDDLTKRLSEASGQVLRAISAEAAITSTSPTERLKTIRYVLNHFIHTGASADFTALLADAARETVKIRSAVAEGALRLEYQPIVTLDGEKLHHYEALSRFDDGKGPAETIKLAEELDLIVDLDLAVLKLVSKTLAASPASMKIAANISAVSLMSPGFVTALTGAVSSNQVAPDRLLIEVTETAQIEKLDQAKRVIAELRRAGHPVCLDDFGAGAASLEYVGEFEFDFIKIDGRYMQALMRGGREALLVKHMAALCRDLGVATIAEMVETREMADKVKALGIAFGQGWAFGKPEPGPNWVASRTQVKPAARRQGAVEGWG
jgi:EAL domain-containing protein (putative c-di-GMP-specific phosphodiesterase class I)